jgi:hypothetical protein
MKIKTDTFDIKAGKLDKLLIKDLHNLAEYIEKLYGHFTKVTVKLSITKQ